MIDMIFYWNGDENNAKQILISKFLDDSRRHTVIPDRLEFNFTSYDFDKYSDQDLLRSKIESTYGLSTYGNPGIYYYSGVKYDTYEDLFKDLNKDRKILELSID